MSQGVLAQAGGDAGSSGPASSSGWSLLMVLMALAALSLVAIKRIDDDDDDEEDEEGGWEKETNDRVEMEMKARKEAAKATLGGGATGSTGIGSSTEGGREKPAVSALDQQGGGGGAGGTPAGGGGEGGAAIELEI